MLSHVHNSASIRRYSCFFNDLECYRQFSNLMSPLLILRAETFAHRNFARINFRELIKFAKVNAHDFFGKWSFAKVCAREKFENRDKQKFECNSP